MDKDQLRYDLSLLYAQAKLNESLGDPKTIEDARRLGCAEWELEIDQLREAFNHAYEKLDDL